MKSSPTILARACLMLSFCVSSTASSTASSNDIRDPVTGRWRWADKQIVECKADHTFSVTPTNRTGTWKLLPDKAAERKYVFTWDDGLFVDRLTMSRGGKELKGQNQDGKKIRATKIE